MDRATALYVGAAIAFVWFASRAIEWWMTRRVKRALRAMAEPAGPRSPRPLPPPHPAAQRLAQAHRAARVDRDMSQRWDALVGAQPTQAREWEPPAPAPDPDDDLRLAHTMGELLGGGASHEAATHHHHHDHHGHGGDFGGGGASGDWGASSDAGADVDVGDCGGGGGND